jgi:hypothetical protein
VRKMSLHMKSCENLTTNCTAMSHRKLIYDFIVFVSSVLLVTGTIGLIILQYDFIYVARFTAYNIPLLLFFAHFNHVMSHWIISYSL